MSSKIHLVIPTKKTKHEYLLTSSGKTVSTLFDNSEYSIIESNHTSLSVLYNDFLNKNTNDNDIVVFMHDDVEIHDHFIKSKLIKAHETYDVVGLAGAKSQDYSKSSAWHTAANNPSELRGIVAHVISSKYSSSKIPYINSSFFGPTPSEVNVIDGLFISINVRKLCNDNNLPKFDEDFDFHFYDLSFCVDCTKRKLKIGVYPIFVIHHGLGDSMMSESWKNNEINFKVKYKNYKI